MESSWIHEEMEALRKLRDELRVQINLGGREAKDRFHAAERRWKELENRTRRIGNASKLAADEIGAGLRELAHEDLVCIHCAAPREQTLSDVATRASWQVRVFDLITSARFLPSIPIPSNAGRGGQLAACFVLEAHAARTGGSRPSAAPFRQHGSAQRRSAMPR